MFKPATARNIDRARELRREMTKEERKLWYELRALRKLQYHFRRQAPFCGYYLDFVEHNARLVVEVDGDSHFDQSDQQHDQIRDRVLARQGYKTLRFDNAEVRGNVDGVIAKILAELGRRDQRPPPGTSAETAEEPTSPQRGR